MHTLAMAATAVGVDKPTILHAIMSGKISAVNTKSLKA